MKKVITLVLSLITLITLGNPVDKRQAEQIAVNQYELNAPSGITDFSVNSMFETTYDGMVTFYTFTFTSGGFVMVAADDASIPVLGYSYESALTADIYNPAAKAWFDDYSKAISEISKTRMSNASTRPMWDQILNKQISRSPLDVAPLVTTNWDQGCYYNANCPAEPNAGPGSCGKAWTGCVATTMSVIMKYHQWPTTGVGSHTYTPAGYPAQSANFGTTTYNYAAMPNSVNSANAAVATLMHHAGVSVNMQYGASGSGAYSEDVPFALVNYFKFDANCHLKAKADYPVMNDWYAIIRTELDASRPVYYAGSSTASGGHAWICDGYRMSDNKFHMNWGWSGSANGYFAIGSLNPSGNNFNDENRVIVNAMPGDGTMSWIIQNTHFTAASRGINFMHAVNENVAWAAAYDGSGGQTTISDFAKTTNGGETWTTGQVMTGTTYGIGNICGISATTAYVALFNGTGNQNNTCGIYKTSNGGTTWVQLPGALQGSSSFANNVYFWNEQEGMCHGDVRDGYFEIYTTVNGGQTWQRVPQANITGGTPASGEGGWTSVIEATGENTIMFGTNKGKVYISDDRGFHWRVTNSNITPATNGGINLIAFSDPMHGIVGQSQGTVTFSRTSDGGATWQTFTPNGPLFTNDLTSVPGTLGTYVSTGAATGATGASYSTDNGTTWTLFPTTDTKQFLGTDFFNNSVGYAGGFNTDQNNDGMFRFMGTLGAATPGPQIAADPQEITETLEAGATTSVPLFIINNGDENLTWTITIDGAPNWVSAGPPSGSTAAGSNSEISVILNATGLTAGTFNATITIANNSINAPTLEVPVTLIIGSDLEAPENLAASVSGNNVTLTWDEVGGGGTGEEFFDDFESYDNFSLSFSPWTNVDSDGGQTYIIDGYNWENGGDPQSFIIFNSLNTTPAMAENVAFSGEKIAACFNSVPPPFNNDWLITPKRLVANGDVASFMAASYTDQYGMERFKVAVSTTTPDPASFTVISSGSYVSAPAAWTEFTYDLSAYAGQEIYVAINCVSQDAFFLMVDDFYMGPAAKKPASSHNAAFTSGLLAKAGTSSSAVTPGVVRGGERALIGYNVYRNGSKITANPVTETTYNDNGLAEGTYEYHVTAVYDEGESGFSNAAEVTIGGGTGNNLILDFEAYSDFTLDINPWTNLDVDGSETYAIEEVTFPHAGEAMSFIVFNPLATTPAVTGMEAHGGSRLGACFASVNPPNNDYLISPKVLLGDDAKISMWVKSYTDQYGLEKYNIAVSTTDMNPSSFQKVVGPVNAPADTWTFVEYDLSQFSGQEAYVAVQCVSNDAFIFMVDDISITFSTGASNIVTEKFHVYPNPVSDNLNIRGESNIISLSLINTAGNVVVTENVNAKEHNLNVSDLPAGLYILKATTAQGVITRKVNVK